MVRHARWLGIGLLLIVLGLLLLQRPAPPEDDLSGQVRQVCAAYADLDLAQLAPLCVRVGYQQRDNPTAWPYVVRTLMPEDLDR
jgi:hypothetical protein